MGFVPPHLKRAFVVPHSSRQAYRQFGNAVVVPQVGWLARAIVEQAGPVFAIRMAADAGITGLSTGLQGSGIAKPSDDVIG